MAMVMVGVAINMVIAVVCWRGKTRRWTVEYWTVFSRCPRGSAGGLAGVTSRNNTSTTWNTVVRWHGYEKYCQKLTFVTEVAAGPLTLFHYCSRIEHFQLLLSLPGTSVRGSAYIFSCPAAMRLLPRNNTGG